jgi:hypothetical protein
VFASLRQRSDCDLDCHVGYPCLVGNTALCIADNSYETFSYGVLIFMLFVCSETELMYGAFRRRT